MARRRIIFEGSAPLAGELVQMLEEEGIDVQWNPSTETRGGIVEAVVVSLVVSGAYDEIKTGVRRFLSRVPRASVVIENDRGRRSRQAAARPR